MPSEPAQGKTVPEKIPADVLEAMRNPARVLGRYVLIRLLGKGGMGTVYRAWQLDLRRWVAVKLITGPTDAEGIARFYREAQTAAKLQHPGIVAIHEVGVEKGRHFIAMEYVAGVTLDEWMRAEAPPGLEAILGVLRDVALAVDTAHRQGIIHRDLKPGNILVDKAGRAHVADFGLAKQLRRNETLTQTGMVVGTPSYMSPEQAEGESARIDRRADIWSLGVILYRILTGRLPFVGKGALEILHKVVDQDPRPPRRVNPAVAPGIEAICLRALAKKRSDRYPTAREFAEDIDRFLRGEAPHARPLTGWRSFVGAVRKRRVPISVGAIILALAVVASIALLRPRSEAPPQSEAPPAKAPQPLRVEYEFVRSLPLLLDREKTFARLSDRIEKVKGLLRGAIDKDPRSADAHYLMGRIWHITGRYREALESYSSCLKIDPKFALAYHHRARLHTELALFGDVLGIALRGASGDTYRNRAAQDAAQALRLSKGLLDATDQELSLAYDRYWKGETDEVLRLCRERKDSAEFHVLAGIVHYQARRYGEALEEFDRALRIRPWFYQVMVYQAVVRNKLGRPSSEVLADLSRAAETHPGFAAAFFARAVLLEADGRIEEALKAARHALALDLSCVRAYVVIIHALDALDRMEETKRAIEAARRALGEDSELDVVLGRIDERRNRPKEAHRRYSEAIRKNPSGKRAYSLRSRLALKTGDLITAAADAAKAFGLDATNAFACETAGIAWYRLKKYDKALEWYDRAIALEPRDKAFRWSRANIHLILGNEKEALGDLRKVRELDPNYLRKEVEDHLRRLSRPK